MDYFVVDIETSGPAPAIHNLLSVGVTHVRRFEGRYKPFDSLYFEVKPVFDGFYPPAMAIHGLDEDRNRAPEVLRQVFGERGGDLGRTGLQLQCIEAVEGGRAKAGPVELRPARRDPIGQVVDDLAVE